MTEIVVVLCVIQITVLGAILGLFIGPLLSEKRKKVNKEIKPRFYITGDKHRDFRSVRRFCRKKKTNACDVLTILGDSGINYFLDERDVKLKNQLSKLKITLLCIHGNKESRPEDVGGYGIKSFCGGHVFYEPQFPNILFAIDGETYNLSGNEYLVIGGAHSVDKYRCLAYGKPYWSNEHPSAQTQQKVNDVLKNNKTIYGFLTHTCPMKYIPTEVLLSTKEKNETDTAAREQKKGGVFRIPLDVDNSVEEWLDGIEDNTEYSVWYCGHYHVDKVIDRVRMLHGDIIELS